MNEAQPIGTKPKKMVSRNVAIALGIIGIILVVGLLGAVLQISSLSSKVSDLTDTLNMGKSTILVNNQTVSQTADNYTSWMFNYEPPYEISKLIEPWPLPSWSIKYAGILWVTVRSSTNKTYVRAIYAGWFDSQEDVGTTGGAIFPVFPSGNIEIRVGNTNTTENATETVTITYYY